MKKNFLLLMLFIPFILSFSSYSQDFYSKVLYGTGYEELQSISVTNTFDDGFIISGIRNSNNVLIKIDAEANIIWEMYFGHYYQPFNEVITLSDSNFLFVGTHYDQSYGYSLLNCIKFNADGDTLWTSFIDMSNSFVPKSVVESFNSGLLVVGRTHYPGGDPYMKIGIIKLDSNGHFVWGKELFEDNASNNEATDVVQFPSDSSYYITGVTSHLGPWRINGFLMKIEPNGDINFAKHYYSAYGMNNSEFHTLLLDGDSLLVSGNAGPSVIIKTDSEGEIGWSRRFFEWGQFCNFDIYANTISKPNDSTYILLKGSTVFNLNIYGDFRHSTFLWMCASDVAKISNNEYMVTGNGPILGVSQKIPNDPQIGVATMDLEGNAYLECSEFETSPYNDTITIQNEYISFEVEELGNEASSSIDFGSSPINSEISCVAFVGSIEENQETNFKIYPSPTNGNLKVESLNDLMDVRISVLNLHGKAVFNSTSSDRITNLDLTFLPNGIYMVVLTSNFVESHQIIIQR